MGPNLLGLRHSLFRQSLSNLTCLIVIWAKVKIKKCSLCYFWWGGHLRLGFWWIDVAPKMPLSSLLQSQSFHFMKTSSSDMGEKIRSRYFQRSLACMSQNAKKMTKNAIKNWQNLYLFAKSTCFAKLCYFFARKFSQNFAKTVLAKPKN